MNAAFHKKQAEGLIRQVNSEIESGQVSYRNNNLQGMIALAQVHATLANAPEDE